MLETKDRHSGQVALMQQGGVSNEPIAVGDGKLIHRLSPLLGCTPPVGRDVAQRQPDQLGSRVVAREVTSRLDDLAQPRVDALDGVGRVDHPANGRCEREERDHPIPGPAPSGHHRRELAAPGPGFEGIELGRRRLGTGCRVDRLQGRRQQFALLPARELQAVAH